MVFDLRKPCTCNIRNNQQFGSQCFKGLKIHEKLPAVNDVIIRIVLFSFSSRAKINFWRAEKFVRVQHLLNIIDIDCRPLTCQCYRAYKFKSCTQHYE